eukprot:TRINITY_DN670_c3_g1_i1.p1 TRINITY_DN670_c3_g1~~TRINITY_DN670_c3_g1_i1.p1  ORF type:complete len:334 (+),score=36.63 TRINITY_DN670_c3_g1_i1:60-1061(+)
MNTLSSSQKREVTLGLCTRATLGKIKLSLHYARLPADLKLLIVEFLLDHDADRQLSDTLDGTSAMLSIVARLAGEKERENLAVLACKKACLNHDIPAIDKIGENISKPTWNSVFVTACSVGNIKVVAHLLKTHPEIDIDYKTSGANISPLTAVSRNSHSHLIKILLGRGCNVNSRLANGETALHLAAKYDFPSVAKELLSSPSIQLEIPRSSDGGTALYVAALHGHTGLVRLLASHGASMTPSATPVTPVEIACQGGFMPTVAALLSLGAPHPSSLASVVEGSGRAELSTFLKNTERKYHLVDSCGSYMLGLILTYGVLTGTGVVLLSLYGGK